MRMGRAGSCRYSACVALSRARTLRGLEFLVLVVINTGDARPFLDDELSTQVQLFTHEDF
jgi:hypothetical protein